MQDFLQSTAATLGQQLPRVIGALAIFIVGWLIALMVRSAIRKLLNKTTVDEKLTAAVGSDAESSLKLETLLPAIFYWLVLILAGVASLDALGLQMVAGPLNALTGQVLSYLPKLFGAFLVLVVAWVVATVCRNLVKAALTKIDADKRLGGQVGTDEVPISKTISDLCYWLIFLFFLPGVLSVLEVDGLLEPVRLMMDRFLEFLPRLFAAVIIFATGWIAAKIVSNIAMGLLAAAGLDKGAEKLGVAKALGNVKITRAIGTIVFAFILLPAIVGALDALKMVAVTEPIKNLLQDFVDYVPKLFGATLIMVLVHVLARWLQPLVENLLKSIGTDRVPELLGFGTEGKKFEVSSLLARLFYLAAMTLAALEASGVLGLFSLSVVLFDLGSAVLQVLVGCLIFGVGLYLARLASDTIVASGVTQASLVAALARAGILFLAGAMALRRMGLADEIIETAFGLLLGAVAVALALAFGLGARDVAGEQVKEWVDSLKS
jgi:hypothetical protein